MEKAIFAAGCFWGVEAAFQSLPGVSSAVSGYTGGPLDSPSYEQVCGGASGHAEAVEVAFDPAVVSYEQLLEAFWKMHDPTTPNRQGPDVGHQYRSGIFFLTAGQEQSARASAAKAQENLTQPIVTEISAASTFWPAEDYHQDYFEKRGIASCHL